MAELDQHILDTIFNFGVLAEIHGDSEAKLAAAASIAGAAEFLRLRSGKPKALAVLDCIIRAMRED